MAEDANSIGARLNEKLALAGLDRLDPALAERFGDYCGLLLRWNARTNLTAIRDEDGILSRHFVESVACARVLPQGIATLLDFGSGAGFPGVPIALCRKEIAVTLAESQGKKAAFLREAVRILGISAKVHSGRAELLPGVFDCVALRAVDRMEQAVQTASRLVTRNGWLALMTSEADRNTLQAAVGTGFEWLEPVLLRGSERGLLLLAQSRISEPA